MPDTLASVTSIQDQTSALRRVLVRAPRARDLAARAEFGWRAAPDPAVALAEHFSFRQELELAGAEVVSGMDVEGDPDAIYAYAPALMTDAGAILLRPGKPGRRREPQATALDLGSTGIHIARSITEPATAEGGDMFWLDKRTLLVGRGYRTNAAGIEQLRGLLPETELIAFDLPHHRGPGGCLHLMSLVSLLDRDLAVVYLRSCRYEWSS